MSRSDFDSVGEFSNTAPKLCECGCGLPAPIARQSDRKRGHVIGRPVRFIQFHRARLSKVEFPHPNSYENNLKFHADHPEKAMEYMAKHAAENPNWKKVWNQANPEKYLWHYYRANANRVKGRGDGRVTLPFEIERNDFERLVSSVCHYCGEAPKPVNGLDRVNSALGYLLHNVVPCCRICNQAKNSMTVEEFLTWARRFSEKQFPTDVSRVRAFHHRFGIPRSLKPRFLDQEMIDFRLKFMEEELNEFKSAVAVFDLPNAADALVDLCYVILGTAIMMGLPWEELFSTVQEANMSKTRAKADGSDSKRGSGLDVVKPKNWQAPNHIEILMRAGWPGPELPLGGR